jgi:hypothetical protein
MFYDTGTLSNEHLLIPIIAFSMLIFRLIQIFRPGETINDKVDKPFWTNKSNPHPGNPFGGQPVPILSAQVGWQPTADSGFGP